MNKIGIGIITCNRHNYLAKLLTSLTRSLKDVKDVVVKAFLEYFTIMYQQRMYWESKFKSL